MLNEKMRLKLLRKIVSVVEDNFYDAELLRSVWPQSVRKHTDQIVNAPSDEVFEAAVGKLLSELKSSHVGLYHTGFERCTSKMAICATYSSFPFGEGERWVFQDIHEGGPADLAGLRAGDVLIAVNGRLFQPPQHPFFPMKASVTVEVLTAGLKPATRTLKVPAPIQRPNQLPFIEPNPIVSQRRLSHDMGYVRIAKYPGEIGVEIANEISAALKGLNPIERLIVDLRGNSGGGIGVLRLMSFLTEEQIVVGTSSNGTFLPASEVIEQAFVLDRIPARKSGLFPLGARYFRSVVTSKLARRKHQVRVVTEGLGPQPFHGRVVLLIDRHTASANEMLLAHARENRLATIVGEPSPGRMLGGQKFKLHYDYWLALPKGSFRTAAGNGIEGRPIVPDVLSYFDPELARVGRDSQLEKAIEVVAVL